MEGGNISNTPTESVLEKSKQIVAIARVCVLLYVIMLPNHGYLIRLSRFSAAAATLAVELSCVLEANHS